MVFVNCWRAALSKACFSIKPGLLPIGKYRPMKNGYYWAKRNVRRWMSVPQNAWASLAGRKEGRIPWAWGMGRAWLENALSWALLKHQPRSNARFQTNMRRHWRWQLLNSHKNDRSARFHGPCDPEQDLYTASKGLTHWYGWRSGLARSLGKASNPSPGHHSQVSSTVIHGPSHWP